MWSGNDVTVITPSLPERTVLLGRAIGSVRGQTRQPYEHLIALDYALHGDGHVARNRLVAAATTEWVAFLDDDDAWRPRHLEVMLQVEAEQESDIVCSLIEWTGDGPTANHSCDFTTVRASNWFNPSAALVRRSLLLDVGGFPAPAPPMWDDWAAWIAMLNAGARYACTHDPSASVIYYWHGGNISA